MSGPSVVPSRIPRLPPAEQLFSILNMSLVDLTAEARIRDAAIARFGSQGYAKTTIRQIAADADVSPGLVIHHFGSKEALREACDDYVLQTMIRVKMDVTTDDSEGIAAVMSEFGPEAPYGAYLLRMLTDESAAGARLWDQIVEFTHTYYNREVSGFTLLPGVDPVARAQVLIAFSLSLHAFAPHIARGLGSDELTGDALLRANAALAEILLPAIFEIAPDAHHPLVENLNQSDPNAQS